jgi:type I restriction enzyme S subunit
MTDWLETSLDALGEIITGRTPPAQYPEFFGNDYPFITPTDLDGRRILETTKRGISPAGAASMKKLLVPKDSVTISCIGWQLGKAAIVGRDSFTNQQMNTIVPNASVDSRYLYYHLSTRRGEIQRLASSGTRTPILNKTRFGELRLTLPPFAIQRRIGATLGLYDDFIENSLRQIELLEGMTRAIYDEWFVHFRFPAYESQNFLDSRLGLIPEEWTITDIGRACSYLNRGIAPNYADDGRYLVINQKCIRGHRLLLDRARRQSKPVAEQKLVRFGDVLINSTGVGTLGRVAQVYQDLEEATVDSHVTIARPRNDLGIDWFGLSMMSLQNAFEARGVGSTGQTELNRDAISRELLVMPPPSLQRRFDDAVGSIRRLSGVLANQIEPVASLRDMLVARLATGRIDMASFDLDSLMQEAASESGAVLRGGAGRAPCHRPAC